MVNTKFEREEKFVEGQYVLKKRKTDLTVFGEEKLTVGDSEKKVLFNHQCNRKKYIAKYFKEVIKKNHHVTIITNIFISSGIF